MMEFTEVFNTWHKINAQNMLAIITTQEKGVLKLFP
jgi:hypothetical protein